MSTDRDESFLARWSRRKRSGEPDVDAKPKADVPAKAGDAKPDAAAEPAFDLTTLPRVEDLTQTSDFAQFLQKGVPDELKRMALRRAWSLDPGIRDFVEVAENQYDWNVAGGVPGFGELDPGTDLKALLMQATGQMPEPLDKVAEASENGEPADQASTVVAMEERGIEPPDPTADHDTSANSPHHFATEAEVASPDAPMAPRRARHGGALAGIRNKADEPIA